MPLGYHSQMESPFAKVPSRTIMQTPDGRYMVDGTLVPDTAWTPEVGEAVTTLNHRYQPAGTIRYQPPAPAAPVPNMFSRGVAGLIGSVTPSWGSAPNATAGSDPGALDRLIQLLKK